MMCADCPERKLESAGCLDSSMHKTSRNSWMAGTRKSKSAGIFGVVCGRENYNLRDDPSNKSQDLHNQGRKLTCSQQAACATATSAFLSARMGAFSLASMKRPVCKNDMHEARRP